MSYPDCIDEVPIDTLHRELERRANLRSSGLCDYCQGAIRTRVPCKFPDRHILTDEPSRPLTFGDVSVVNRSRCKRWHDDSREPWTGADWSNAMCGEAGEAANVVKKLRRHETRTSPQGDPDEAALTSALAEELADVILYLDLLAEHYGIDLPGAIRAKFNLVSERQGFPERL